MSFPIDSFIDLPYDVCLYFISKWMTPGDLCRFDTSVCNHKKRNYLLLLIKSKPFSIVGIDSNGLCRVRARLFNEWIVSRSIKVESLFLYGSFQMELSFSSHNFEKIKRLEFAHVNGEFDCVFEISTIINKCKFLNHLIIFEVDSFNEVFKNIHVRLLIVLHKFKLFSSHGIAISSHVAEKITEFCSRLVHLDLYDNHPKNTPDYVVQLVKILNANPGLLCIVLYNGSLDDTILYAIRTSCKSVRQVHLSGSTNFTLNEAINTRDSCFALTSFLVLMGNLSLGVGDHMDVVGTFRTVKSGNMSLVKLGFGFVLSFASIIRVVEIPIIKLCLCDVLITSNIITSIARHSPRLEQLCVDSCGVVFSLRSMLKITVKCLNLSHLHLGSCYQFTPQNLVTIFTGCRSSLRVMSVAMNDRIQNRDVQQIFDICGGLEEICMSDCDLISPHIKLKHFCCDNTKCTCQPVLPYFHQKFDEKMFKNFFDEDEQFDM